MSASAERIGALLEELKRAKAKEDLLSFMRYVWWNPFKFDIGRHTVAICERLTRAVEDFRKGKSTYLIITVPFRHGKSDIVSRALPAYFLGRNADMQPDVIMTGYGADLIEDFSRKAMNIVRSSRFQSIFPIQIGMHTAKKWAIEGSNGVVSATGLGGAITGKGGHLIIIDDYCKSREEAVSEARRRFVWDAFRNDVFTRQNSPACLFLITATPWHTDDLIGRIRRAAKEEPNFPNFEVLSFPARKEGPNGWDYLFPEHYSPEWYDTQRAVLGKQAAALLDCAPSIEGGERFDVKRVIIHNTLDGWYHGKEVRAWDLASSAKERDKDDPDWTWGVRGSVKKVPVGHGLFQHEIWIRSMVCCREEAPARDKIIVQTAAQDGPSIAQAIEGFGAYKDTYANFKSLLSGTHMVRRSAMSGDKSAKAAPLEASFDAGLVHVYLPDCESAFQRWKEDFSTFPNGKHDDAVDATAIMFHECTKSGSMALF